MCTRDTHDLRQCVPHSTIDMMSAFGAHSCGAHSRGCMSSLNHGADRGMPACSSAPPRLITDVRQRVPRGTNGGVSALGLKAGAAGGALMGAAFWLAGGDPGFREWAGCPGSVGVGGALVLGPLGLGKGAQGQGLGWLLAAAALGAALGTLGTLLDSLLGATLQARHLLPVTTLPHVCTPPQCVTRHELNPKAGCPY